MKSSLRITESIKLQIMFSLSFNRNVVFTAIFLMIALLQPLQAQDVTDEPHSKITIYDENGNELDNSDDNFGYGERTYYVNADEEKTVRLPIKVENIGEYSFISSESRIINVNMEGAFSGDPYDGYLVITMLPITIGEYQTTIDVISEDRQYMSTVIVTCKCLFEEIPIDISFNNNKTEATLSWTKPDNAVQTYITDDTGAEIAYDVNTCSFTKTGLTANNSYCFNFKFTYIGSPNITQSYEQTRCVDTHIGITFDNRDHFYVNGMSKTFDLSAVFDEKGNALMNEIYIYDAGKDVTNKKCYIYTKDKNSNSYSSKNSDFDPTATVVTIKSNGKYYFTGDCEGAFSGGSSTKTKTDYETCGHITITSSIDLYLDNFNIHTVSRANNSVYPLLNVTNIIGCALQAGSLLNPVVRGQSHIFSFKSNATDVKVHIRGDNRLQPNSGWKFRIDVDCNIAKFSLPEGDKNAGYTVTGSAFANSDYSQTMNFTFDDIWDSNNTRTNGILRLPGYAGENSQNNAGSIDVGNESSTVTFNGGQYYLQSPLESSTKYSNSLPICYHKEIVSISTLHNFGGDFADVVVTINDGTFYTYPVQGVSAKNDKIKLSSRYTSPYDLRLPAGTSKQNSSINGGTFNLGDEGHVYFITQNEIATQGQQPKNSKNQVLCRAELRKDYYASFEENANRTQKITLEEQHPNYDEFQTYGSDALNIYTYEILNELVDNDNIKSYESTGEFVYDVAHVYLPSSNTSDWKCEEIERDEIYFWQTVMPAFSISNIKTDGSIEVKNGVSRSGNNIKVKYFAYLELDDNIRRVNSGLTLKESYALNKDPFVIGWKEDGKNEGALYTVLSYNSNQWYNFTAPFDISEIYVLEWPSAELKTGEITQDFLDAQAVRYTHLVQDGLYWQIAPASGKTGTDLPLENLLNTSVTVDDVRYLSNCKQIIPYDGSNIAEANFYAYRIGEDNVSLTRYGDYNGLLNVKPGQDGFNANYGNVQKDKEGVWMHKGHTYDIYFPANTKTRYWDGKFIIFKGYGPQVVETSVHEYGGNNWLDSDALDDIKQDDGYLAKYQGNYTFAQQSIQGYIYQPNAKKHGTYERSGSEDKTITIEPTRGFIVVDGTGLDRVAGIARNGKITYTDEMMSNITPLISDNAFIAWGTQNTINIESYTNQQVSIFTSTGLLYWTGNLSENQYITLPAQTGIYIIRTSECAVKIVVE